MEQQAMLTPGTLLRGGAYRVERALSSGGFGNTYVVTNLNFDVVCAMKEFFMKGINLRDGNTVTVSVPDNRPSFDAQRDKFKKEAQRLWRLKNDHIVKVHDLFEENGTVYYVMDFIDGESLGERLKRQGRPLTEDELLPLLRQALDALESVHNQKIWHLDIKPANMMVNRQEQLFLIDFGASKQLHTSDGHSVATSSAMAFTPGYAPLEQTDQNFKLFGPWTDLYALGASVFKLLTDQTPPSASEIIAMGGRLQFPPQVSPRMQQLISWMMKPAYVERPQSAAEVREFLDKPDEVAPGEDGIGAKVPGEDEETQVVTKKTDDDETLVVEKGSGAKVQGEVKKPEVQEQPIRNAQPSTTDSEPSTVNPFENDEKKKPWGKIIGIIAAVLVLGIGGYFALSGGGGSSTDSADVKSSIEQKMKEEKRVEKMEFSSSANENGTYSGPIDENGKPHGIGHYDATTFTYDGPFEHGVLQGKGAKYVSKKDGSRFEGEMKNGFYYSGKYTAADGSRFEGTFDAKGYPEHGSWYDEQGKKLEDM